MSEDKRTFKKIQADLSKKYGYKFSTLEKRDSKGKLDKKYLMARVSGELRFYYTKDSLIRLEIETLEGKAKPGF